MNAQQRILISKINAAAQKIANNSIYGSGTHIVTSKAVADELERTLNELKRKQIIEDRKRKIEQINNEL